MKVILKLLSLISVWGLVTYVIVYVDPETIKDIGIEGYYLPFLVMILFAVWYTIMIVYRSNWLALIIAMLAGLAMVLSIFQLMTPFTLIVILLLGLFSLYLFKKRDLVSESVKRDI